MSRPLLWKVTGPRGALVIQATHQGTDASDVSALAWRELEATSLYVTEVDEAAAHESNEEADGDDPIALFHLPRGTSLRALLGDDAFAALQERTQLHPNELARMKPWVAFILLGRTAYAFPERSMTDAMLARARDRNTSLLFLETWEQQVAYLDAAITPPKLRAAIRGADKLPCDLTRRLAAFRAGNDAVFANEVQHPDEPVVSRTRAWTRALDQLIVDGKRAFVALGVGHLVGPYGILTRLAARGYVVERL